MKCSLQNSAKVGISIIFLLILIRTELISQKTSYFTQKGSIELGGSIDYSRSNSPDDYYNKDKTYRKFSMSTYIGYFLFDGFEIGLSPLGYSNDHNTVFDISDKKKYYLTISQINTYFSLAYNINLNKNYYPYVQISYGYIEAKSSSNLEFFSSSKSSGNGYGIRAGIKYSIVQHALLNFGISYQSVSVDEEDPSSQLSFSSGVSIWF